MMTIDELREVIESLSSKLRVDENDLRQRTNRILDSCKDYVLLVKGDLSGIQRYLYSVNASEDTDGGVAKRLRGRSFYLSAICHALAEELTRVAGFDPKHHPSTLHAAGGKFLVALPYSNEIESKLSAWKKTIDQWLWVDAWNELYLNLAWCKCNHKDLKIGFSSGVALPLQKQLDENKLQKFLLLLRGGIEDNDSGWRSFPLYRDSFADECHSCKCLPVKQTEVEEEKNLCEVCIRLQKLGGYLTAPDRSRLEFQPGIVEENHIAINFHDSHAILNEPTKSLPQIAAFVPRWPFNGIDQVQAAGSTLTDRVRDKKDLLCVNCSLDPAKRTKCGDGKDRLVTRFHCLATLAGINDGASKIAVMAADGDDFSYHMNSTPDITLEDQVVLGKLIYQFFGPHLIEMLKDRDGLMVYSGGDDFVIVGPWANVVRIAHQLRQDFTDWTKGRLHFSAGIYITNPQEPIFESINQSQVYLEKAKKESGKDAVQIGFTRIPWGKFGAVFDFANTLAEAENTGLISMAFIYGLYSICEDYERYKHNDEVIGLRYLSRLASHVNRNLKSDWKDDSVKGALAEKLQKIFEEYLLNPKDETLLPYWRFALDWAALKGRSV
jgi:CRISPR-associated protein Csm1